VAYCACDAEPSERITTATCTTRLKPLLSRARTCTISMLSKSPNCVRNASTQRCWPVVVIRSVSRCSSPVAALNTFWPCSAAHSALPLEPSAALAADARSATRRVNAVVLGVYGVNAGALVREWPCAVRVTAAVRRELRLRGAAACALAPRLWVRRHGASVAAGATACGMAMELCW
jgi:hypothetical protein